ncbi:hypothetical protein F511_11830 [Dorcoceras hygrometricum]|uniref:Uncharacterized protein n=1 Tax=Dorcoceras hygrometricum TaxID=472368 RepID=A0A2Z7ASY9_9LAMI|nr:hypothetical protein F511_11830 [Dorcoceras hygrometricum]
MNQSGPTEPAGSIEPNPFTKENLNRAPSLHARRRDHLLVLVIVLPAPATTTGALMTGPPLGPSSTNLTDLVSNCGLTSENWSLQVDAPSMLHDDVDLRGTDVVGASSGRNRLWITKLLQRMIIFEILCAKGGEKTDCTSDGG